MNTSFSTRKHVSEEEIKSDIAKLNGIIEKLSKVNKDELTRAFTYNTELGLEFASRQLRFQINENITILKTYSEYLKHISKTEENSGHELEESLTPYKTIKDKFPIINGFLNRIRGELQLYPYIPNNVLNSIVKFYLLKYFLEHLFEYTQVENCRDILEILTYLRDISETELITDKKELIPDSEFREKYNKDDSKMKDILEDYSYSIYTHTRYITATFTKVCIFKIAILCNLHQNSSIGLTKTMGNFFRRVTQTSSKKILPVTEGGGKINILIISLYSKPDKFKEKSKVFKEIFKGKAKLIIKNWEDKNGIISQIKSGKIDGIILSGSNFRIKEMNKKMLPDIIFKSNIPILGLCFGFQYLVYKLSSLNNIKSFKSKNYNKYDKTLKINKPFKVNKTKYRFNHHDYIVKLPKNWKISSKYKNIIYMGYDLNKKYIGIQFHPEVHKQSSKFFYNNWLKFIRKYNA